MTRRKSSRSARMLSSVSVLAFPQVGNGRCGGYIACPGLKADKDAGSPGSERLRWQLDTAQSSLVKDSEVSERIGSPRLNTKLRSGYPTWRERACACENRAHLTFGPATLGKGFSGNPKSRYR